MHLIWFSTAYSKNVYLRLRNKAQQPKELSDILKFEKSYDDIEQNLAKASKKKKNTKHIKKLLNDVLSVKLPVVIPPLVNSPDDTGLYIAILMKRE